MPRLPIAIGSYEEQKRFIERNSSFLREYPRLNELSKKVFLRALKSPDRREVERLLGPSQCRVPEPIVGRGPRKRYGGE